MWDVAPASVMLMGLLGLLVVAFSVLRVAVLERRLLRTAPARQRVVPPETRTGLATAA